MKLGIVIPLKAKSISKNWSIVEESLFQTLLSIKNQKCQNFEAVVVGHDCPIFLENSDQFGKNISFMLFDARMPPELSNDQEQNQIKFELDRCSKIYQGYKYLKECAVSHVFSLDADDLLRDDFLECLSNEKTIHSFIIEKGYVFYKSKKILNEIDNFSAFCGSSLVASSKLLENNNTDQDFESFLFRKVGHVAMRNYFDLNNITYTIPKERLVMYIRDNGENISRYGRLSFIYSLKRTLKLLLRYKKLTEELKKRFALNI